MPGLSFRGNGGRNGHRISKNSRETKKLIRVGDATDAEPRLPGFLKSAVLAVGYVAFANSSLPSVRHLNLTGRDGWSLFGSFVVDSAIVLISAAKANALLGANKRLAVPIVFSLGYGSYYHKSRRTPCRARPAPGSRRSSR